MKLLLICFIFLSLVGCEDDDRIERLALLERAQDYDSTVKLVLADELGAGPVCVSELGRANYGKGCVKVFSIKVGLLEMLCIEFESKELAQNEAKRIKQWYYKNWVFDEVTGEPPLEEFIKGAFGAKYFSD